MDAFVLFRGSREGAQGGEVPRVLFPLEGRPLFLYVLKALDSVRGIEQIVVIGPQKMIMAAIERSLPDVLFEKKIVVLNEKAGLFENVQQVHEGSVPVGQEMTDLSVLRQPAPPALFLPAEIPLVTTEEIEAFLSAADLSEYESCLGVAREETLELFHPQGEKPGFKLKGKSVKGEVYRMTHLHLVRPDHSKGVETLQKFYNDPLAPIPGDRTCSLRKFIDYSASKMTGPERSVALKTQLKLVDTTPGGGAVKVDDDESYQIVSLRFREWQSSLMPKKEGEEEISICPLSGHICKEGQFQGVIESE